MALFAAASRFLNLRYAATLICLCFATFLAVTAGLVLERPLPALPFVAGGLPARQRGPDPQFPSTQTLTAREPGRHGPEATALQGPRGRVYRGCVLGQS